MLEKKELLALMKAVAKADSNTPSATYSFGGQSLTYEAMDATLRKELNELAGTYEDYLDNQRMIFSLIQ